MKIERFTEKQLSEEEKSQLETLRTVVEKALEDGQLSIYERENIQALIWADSKMTYEKLRVINETTYQMMGDILPELEWRRVH
ncbi:MAG: hypothetical protein AAFR31_04910 [Cyanobacteria bacterium J06627_8]